MCVGGGEWGGEVIESLRAISSSGAPWKAGVQNAAHFVNLFSVQIPDGHLSYFKTLSAESTLRNDGAQKRTWIII